MIYYFFFNSSSLRTLSGTADVTLARERLLELAALFGHQEVSAFLQEEGPDQQRPPSATASDGEPGLLRELAEELDNL